ncbi:MAG: zf-HC2 domain-containing protein [Verrucomicrobia bacterium]|nr:zf-HC2 domain-containing protein [Verrucomicrobiota bacterium]
MLTCKEVSHLVSESLDRQLPLGKRLGIRIHLLLCGMCATYQKQMILLRTTICRHLEEEIDQLEKSGPCLSDEAKAEIREKLEHASSDTMTNGAED